LVKTLFPLLSVRFADVNRPVGGRCAESGAGRVLQIFIAASFQAENRFPLSRTMLEIDGSELPVQKRGGGQGHFQA